MALIVSNTITEPQKVYDKLHLDQLIVQCEQTNDASARIYGSVRPYYIDELGNKKFSAESYSFNIDNADTFASARAREFGDNSLLIANENLKDTVAIFASILTPFGQVQKV